MQPGLRVLIAGAGVAGPVAAYWLAAAGCEVTVVERSPEFRHSGQGIDTRGAGTEVLRRMGVENAVRENTTREAGLMIVDEKNRKQAEFPAAAPENNTRMSFTADIEIMRGNLTRILWAATKDNVKYVFDTTVTAAAEHPDGIDVHLNDSATPQRFDLVIAADGLFSRTRPLLLGEPTQDPISTLNAHCAYFTLPRTETDTSFSRWFNAPGRRSILIRPVDSGWCSAYMTLLPPPPQHAELRALQRAGEPEQKRYLRGRFADLGWEVPRVLAAMDAADDFYLQEIAQVKMARWSSAGGRAACVGDAAHCPSPFTGMGTTVALVGSYVLAGEVATQIKKASRAGGKAIDVKAACEAWECLMRPFVERAQKLPPGAPWIANPETAAGIWVLRKVAGFVAWSGIAERFGGGIDPPSEWDDMPTYEFT